MGQTNEFAARLLIVRQAARQNQNRPHARRRGRRKERRWWTGYGHQGI